MIHIRKLQPGDEPALWRVFYSAVHGTASAHYRPEQLAVWAPDNADPAAWEKRVRSIEPFVAEREGTIIGYADLQPSGYIDHFFVAAEAGRQGVGSQLMVRIHEQAIDFGIDELYSHVSITARPFFEHWGFTVEVEQTVELRGIELTNYVMRKRGLLSG